MRSFIFSLLLIFSHSLLVFGDSAPILPVQSGCVKPVQNNDVILKSEVVNIYLYRDHYDVEVNYVFVNSGAAQKVLMGFPNHSYIFDCKSIEDFKAFDSTVQIASWRMDAWDSKQKLEDFQNLKISREDYIENYYSFYECFQVVFEKGQTKKIKNTYSQEYVPIYLDTLLKAKYILTTGALWKDNIDSITVNIIPVGISPQYLIKRKAYFKGYTNDPSNPSSSIEFSGIQFKPSYPAIIDDAYRFLFTDTEPDFNIEMSMPQEFINYANATSELKSEGIFSYNAMNMFDNNPATAWAEGKQGGTHDTISVDISPHIRFFTGTYKIKKIGILNGLASDNNLFYANNRVKKIKLIYENEIPEMETANTSNSTTIDHVVTTILNQKNSLTKEVILEDKIDMQYIEFPVAVFMTNVKIIIEEIYPGSKYNDTCISEIQFFPE